MFKKILNWLLVALTKGKQAGLFEEGKVPSDFKGKKG